MEETTKILLPDVNYHFRVMILVTFGVASLKSRWFLRNFGWHADCNEVFMAETSVYFQLGYAK